MDKKILSNPKVLNINRLDGRCSIVPASEKEIYYQNKFDSEFLMSLNGDYRFKYFDDDVFEDFYALDVDESDWDTLAVPAVWEYNGYGLPVYPNVEYPFPFDPPMIDIKNPIGCYRRTFILDEVPENSIIHFDGVDNCFEFYVNGQFAGFSKNCRIATEFDITSLLVKGENLLAIKVYKYSDASYLENQDMLLASGITRDIYLINTKKESIWNYTAETDTTTLSSKVFLLEKGNYSGYTVRAILDGVEQVAEVKDNYAEFTFTPESPLLWNAETPNLYDFNLILEKDGVPVEIHSKRVGFRECHTDGKQHILLNGTAITIKGINRHEYNCKTGRYITVEQILRELRIIKESHINAIRLSHYPNHPATYEIAAELGLYLMDEADVETHGCGVTGDQGFISKLPEWESAYFDRVMRMEARDKNETAVIMWSVGNEYGNGINPEKCHDWLKAREFPKPIRLYKDKGDFIQCGYCKMEVLNSLPDDDVRPALLTEYAHSMGNSPGTLEDYWRKIYHTDRICGGFVWEFKNHGYYKEDENGNVGYLYGGDFGDINSWSNFTLDGFMLSDITKKPAMYELREVHAPAWVDYIDGEIYIMNTNDFLNLNEWELEYRILEDTDVIFKGKRQMDDLAPHCTIRFDDWKKFKPTKSGAKYRVDVIFNKGWHHTDAYKQFLLDISIPKEKFIPTPCNYDIMQNGSFVQISGNNFNLHINNGMICHYEKDGKVFIKDSAKINVFRAPTDNDGIVNLYPRHIAEWEAVLLDDFFYHVESTEVEQNETCVKVITKGKILPHAKFVGFLTELEYIIYADGIVLVSVTADPYGKMPPFLPRFGFVYPMDKEFNNVAWYGRGFRENYSDRKLATPVACYDARIEDMNTFYDVPQENGNRSEVGFATLHNDLNEGFSFIGSDEFEFSYHDFTLENLTKARHRNELKKSDKNYFYIDYKMRGIGSRSCGPDPEEEYEFHPHKFNFAYIIAPQVDKDKNLELLRKDFCRKTEKLTEKYERTPEEEIVQLFDCKE